MTCPNPLGRGKPLIHAALSALFLLIFPLILKKQSRGRPSVLTLRSSPAPGPVIRLFLAWLSFSFFSANVAAQKTNVPLLRPESVVVKITKIRVGFPLKMEMGTGFCLNSNCDLVATNYHVVALAGLQFKIKGQGVLEKYLATGPDDDGAVWNKPLDDSTGPPTKYTPVRDLAIFKLNRPLESKGMRGIGLYPYQLQEGQEVDIYAYPSNDRPLVVGLRKLTRFSCVFVLETSDGQLEFRCELSAAGRPIRPGASGGIVVDRKTQQTVGILRGVVIDENNLAIAVPIWSLADFLFKVHPEAYAKLFPVQVYRSQGTNASSTEPILPDAYLHGEVREPVQAAPEVSPGTIQRRPQESPTIVLLRNKAQSLADNMKNFIAVERLSFGSGETPSALSQYEIRVIDGDPKFRAYPAGRQELSRLPFPKQIPAVEVGSEWSDLPDMVGTSLGLKMAQVEDIFVDGRRVQVFRYRGQVEDHACKFRSSMNYLFFQHDWVGTVACSGDVWTDEDMNILRISEDLALPPSKTRWRNLHAVVLYGWLKKTGEEPTLIPVSISPCKQNSISAFIGARLNSRTIKNSARKAGFWTPKAADLHSASLHFGTAVCCRRVVERLPMRLILESRCNSTQARIGKTNTRPPRIPARPRTGGASSGDPITRSRRGNPGDA